MTDASVKGTRISAATIHKHLVKDGHKVSIISVYVCLRTLRDVAKTKTGGALPQAPPSGYVSSPHVTASPTGEAGAAKIMHN